ncbi:MAG: hypothetical protein Q4E07_04295 [Eubacteriales bacterium]|nr:hypothetical protein [Eubacteriales bacterium]
MYKLLLVTDNENVRNAFNQIDNWGQLMFRPVTILSDAEEALRYLNSHVVDAIGYAFVSQDPSPIQQYITDHPSLPVFQTHQRGQALLDELNRIREFLDQMHREDADSYDEMFVFQMLRDELMAQLLKGQINSEEELVARIKLVRANVSLTMQCYLFDFDLPQGEVYLNDRWHYGAERLQYALRNNFFGKYIDDVYYDVAVLSPRHIRLFAGPAFNTDLTDEEIKQKVMQRVETVLEDIKDYLDLDLDLESTTVLNSMKDLINKNA